MKNAYQEALINLPESGGGGCHTALLGIANHGIYKGLDPQQIFDDIRQHVHGRRRVTNREIQAAINQAMRDNNKVVRYDFKERRPVKEKPPFDGERVRKKIIAKGAGTTEADIWNVSPIKIDWQPEEDPIYLLHHLYQPDDLIFIGERYSRGIIDKTIRTADSWQKYFSAENQTLPHIIPNPLSGQPATTLDEKQSLRADACIKFFRYAVVEFDNLSREEQFAFWWAVNLPVVALIDSGNKSIHGWVRIDGVGNSAEWTIRIENNHLQSASRCT